MRVATRGPIVSRGRDKHVIAVVVMQDTVALGASVVQRIFGPPIPSFAAITGTRSSPYEVVLCGEEARFVLPSGGDLGELAQLDAVRDADTVVVPGVEDPLATRSPEVIDALRDAHECGARMVSFCGGAFALGHAGVLDRRTVTTHWLFANEFRSMFPRAHLEIERLYIDDSPVYTSGGIFAATDLALHLVALDSGQAAANDIGRILVNAPNRPVGTAPLVKDIRLGQNATSTDALLAWIRDNLHQPLTLAELAKHQHLSERSLVRKFRLETGTTVFDWIARERTTRARTLLETTDFAVSEVAEMVGFGSSETLRRHFEKAAGVSASTYRRQFRRLQHAAS
jgi:AraC family transcriptional activator FtrA